MPNAPQAWEIFRGTWVLHTQLSELEFHRPLVPLEVEPGSLPNPDAKRGQGFAQAARSSSVHLQRPVSSWPHQTFL